MIGDFTDWVAGGVGIIVSVGVGQILGPTVGIGAGCGAAILAVMVLSSGRKRYALAGTVFTLGLGALIYGTAVLPAEYGQTPGIALLGFGLLSALIVVIKGAVGVAVRRLAGKILGEDLAQRIWDSLSAFVGLLSIIKAALMWQKEAAKAGGVAGATTIGAVLNLLGIELPIPVWFLEEGLNGSMILYVGGIVGLFYLMSTLHSGWHATKQTASKSAQAAKKAGTSAKATASSARSSGDDEE